MSTYTPLLIITEKGITTTIVVDSIAMWRTEEKTKTTSIYLNYDPIKEIVLDGDWSKELTALYYPTPTV